MAVSEVRESFGDLDFKELLKTAIDTLKEKFKIPNSERILSRGVRGKYDSFRERCREKIHTELLEIEARVFEELGLSKPLELLFGGNPFAQTATTERGLVDDTQNRLRSGVQDLVKKAHERLEERTLQEIKELLIEKFHLPNDM